MRCRIPALSWALCLAACVPQSKSHAELLATCGASPPPQTPPEPGRASLVVEPALELPSWDSGDLAHRCLATGPWGSDSWGVEAASFLDSDRSGSFDRGIDGARLALSQGVALVSAQDESGRWAFARFIQGDVWGGTNCGPVSWHQFTALPLAGRRILLDFDVCLAESELLSLTRSWILVGANVWLSGPTLPERGVDRHGLRPMVLDLMVHHRTNMLGIRDGSHENELAYHYQASVGRAPLARWRHVSIDLSRQVGDAAARFGLQAYLDDLAIHQIEFVAEVHHARAAAKVDNFSVRAE